MHNYSYILYYYKCTEGRSSMHAVCCCWRSPLSIHLPLYGAPALLSHGVGAITNSSLPVRSLSFLYSWGVVSSIVSSSAMWLSSSHTHSWQQRPGSVVRRGRAQRQSGRDTWCGQRGMQPTTPSMQVQRCSQLGWKFSPCWYTRPSSSHGRPWASAVEWK